VETAQQEQASIVSSANVALAPSGQVALNHGKRSMSSKFVVKRSSIEQLKALRQPNLQILAASNRQPDGADHIPVKQRQTILTVGVSSCRWPIGDPQQSGFYLCGAKAVAQHSYCARHMQIAYVPASRPRRIA
jgi:GcrA cell cycle regulator